MALCTACDLLARALSAFSGSQICNEPHSNTADLLESAENCRLCKFLISCIGTQVYTSTQPGANFTVMEHLTLNSNCRGRLIYSVGFSPSVCNFEISSETNDGEGSIPFTVVFWAEDGSPASTSGFMHRNSPRIDPISTTRLITTWLKDCREGREGREGRESHKECRKTISGEVLSESNNPTLPNRVLDLGPRRHSRYIRLLETNGRQGQYCALSHCWGPRDKRPIATTRYTLGEYAGRGIEIKKLPKTYQDAVTVTREIGVRYLWIDSLCIVQDDTDEWKKESGKMGKIYERAILTIAASGAQDSTRGCFISKSHELSSVPIPYFSDLRDISGSGCFYLHQIFDTSPAWTPLQSRGWAFQEWCLSRRIIHFTEGGVSWKCKKHETDEYYDTTIDMQQYPEWDSLLQDYSTAKFTFNKDRLVALQGLASEMQIDRSDHYYFGFWTADLPAHLLWMRVGAFHDGLPDTPSWTWASKLGEKLFWSTQFTTDHNRGGIGPGKISIEDSGIMKIRDAYIKGCTASEPGEPPTPCSSCTDQNGLEYAKTIMEFHVTETARYLRTSENSPGCSFGVTILDGEPGPDLYCLYILQAKRRRF